MAGSLILVDSDTASNSASITLSNMSSTYDVYKVTVNKLLPVNDNVYVRARFTESGTPNTTSNYDHAYKNMYSSAFSNSNYPNRTFFYMANNYIGTGTQEQFNAVCYIFNSQASDEYTFITNENISRGHTYSLWSNQGGGVFTVASVVDGIEFSLDSGNISSGEFKLYGLKK
tara:strand:+ start:19 stop:534 length:516 start_codon:yes stop_codon:yes gene_type:complete